jgi:hypothetical protein
MDDTPSPPSVQESFSDHIDAVASSRDFSAVVLGDHLMQPWYSSSYPKKLVGDATSAHCKLYVCEICFKYTIDVARAVAHRVSTTSISRSTLGLTGCIRNTVPNTIQLLWVKLCTKGTNVPFSLSTARTTQYSFPTPYTFDLQKHANMWNSFFARTFHSLRSCFSTQNQSALMSSLFFSTR